MRLVLDTVQGAELDSGIGAGRILRTGLILDITLPSTVPDPSVLVRSLATSGMPQKGDAFPYTGYDQYFCKRHIIRPVSASICTVSIVYEFYGLLTVDDSSTLTGAQTQIHPKDFKPIKVTYSDVDEDGHPTTVHRILTLNTQIPLRHLTVSKTIAHEASEDVIAAFRCVNQNTWFGLPRGYWLMSGIEGMTQDDGITFTYTAIFSTKQIEDWSQMGFMTDDAGQVVTNIVDADVATCRALPYYYGQQTTYNGMTLVGMYDVNAFETTFGIG